MTIDREEITRRAVAAFEHAAGRLSDRGVSDLEIGRAMVAAGLSRWSRAVTGQQLVDCPTSA
ncbi:hypothetical protein, partial [Methylobacterium trifolii]|uniref:hypothetical protein n=1 Tax=Methylobacterium trifolii TaxID=1003092 RepID=UPI001EDCD736